VPSRSPAHLSDPPHNSVSVQNLADTLQTALVGVIRLMSRLRAPDGCPWDRAQDHQSLRQNLLEETYEVIHAIETRDDALLKEELGDLLLQVIFHAQIAAEQGRFDLEQVARELTDKLIRRHPHVFGDVTASNADEALASWHTAKRSEGEHTINLDEVPRTMPALLRARKVQQRAARVGFQWPDVNGALAKLDEELAELKHAIGERRFLTADPPSTARIESELGDVLFVLACIANYLGICPEIALNQTTEKFIRRFQHIEQRLAEQGLTPEQATLEQMDFHWDEAKEME